MSTYRSLRIGSRFTVELMSKNVLLEKAHVLTFVPLKSRVTAHEKKFVYSK